VYYLNTDEYRTERTVYGQQKEIILPDSSVVLLNGNSSVRYAAAWPADRHREIWLEGEAYFSVRHTRNHRKFTVRTPDQLAVEVLGTRFSVTNRRGTTEVVLAEGKVQVSDARDSYLMQPGDMIRYSRQDRQLVPQRTNPERAISWKDKLLIFEDEPVENIVQRLRDSHGIRVEFRNRSIPGELFNGSIPGDSVEVFFDKLEKLYPVRISRQNDIYIIE
jgi:transmembrane sensor